MTVVTYKVTGVRRVDMGRKYPPWRDYKLLIKSCFKENTFRSLEVINVNPDYSLGKKYIVGVQQ